MSEPVALCVTCRSTFTEEQIAGANACPACGSRGVPADPRQKAAIQLTHHEWRLLFIWADQWARHIAAQDPEGHDSPGVIASLVSEAKRQAPTLPSLTLFGDVRELADTVGTLVEFLSNGERLIFQPPKTPPSEGNGQEPK